MATTWVDFKDVRQRLNFTDVLSHFNITAGKGSDFKITCPFHDDKKPSCSINTKKNVFHCFSCGAKGNGLDFVTLMNDGDPAKTGDVREGALLALEILGDSPKKQAKKSKNSATGGKKKKKRDKGPKKKKNPALVSGVANATFGEKTSYKSDDEPEAVELVPLTFELKLNPSHAFMRDRGITTEIAERHGIGYCNRGMMKGRVCFPLYNGIGDLVGYSGRYVDTGGEVPTDTSRYKLPKGFPKSQVLFNLENANAIAANNHNQFIGRTVYIVEGFWTAIRLHELGMPAVATLGANLSQVQIDLLTESNFRSAVVLFDNDEAGRAGTSRALYDLALSNFWMRSINLTDHFTMRDFLGAVENRSAVLKKVG